MGKGGGEAEFYTAGLCGYDRSWRKDTVWSQLGGVAGIAASIPLSLDSVFHLATVKCYC